MFDRFRRWRAERARIRAEKRDMYQRTEYAGVVARVQTGKVWIDTEEHGEILYDFLSATMAIPGRPVHAGQIIGKFRRNKEKKNWKPPSET